MRYKRPRISKVFLRYFFSFLLILMIPLLVLGGISRNTIRNIMNDSESARKIASLSRCTESVDNELSNITTIVFKAYMEQDFSPYRMSDFVQNSLSCMNRLKSYKTASSFIQEIYLFSPYSDYIFSAGTTYTYERFISQKIPKKLSDSELPDFLLRAVEDTKYGYIPSLDQDTLFFVFPLPDYTLPHYAYMLFEVPQKALLGHFDPVMAFSDSELMIFDSDRLIAASFDHPEERLPQILQSISRLPHDETAGYLNPREDGVPLFYYTTENSGLSYVLSLPDTEAAAQVDQVIHLFTFHLILTALLGTLAIYILARLNYSPLQKLVKSTNGLFGTGSQENDEINYLCGFVRKSQSAYLKMNLALQDSLVATKYFFIKNLVNAHPYSPEELDDMQERTSMHFKGSHIFVVIFHLHSKDPAVTSDIADFLSVYESDDINGYAAGGFDENIVGIYSCDCTDSGGLNIPFSLLRQSVCDLHHVMLTLGIGDIRPDLSGASASFLEASAALDCRFIVGKNKVIAFNDLKLDAHAEIDYPQSAMDKICLSIKTGEKEPLFQTLTALFDRIRTNAYSMYVAKLLCYDITNNIIKTLQSMAESNAGFELPNLIALTSFETLDELEQMLHRYCDTACAFVNSLKPPTLSDQAIKLVYKNYAMPDFSVAGIAEALGISLSCLSRTFKEEKSVTLNDYIKWYRISLAKKMLAETTEPIEKIVRLLGYYDCSSFIRMFRRSEGMTPGEYRRLFPDMEER